MAHGTSERGGDLHGPEGFIGLHERLLDAFPDINIQVQDCIGEGDLIAVRWTATMHHRGNGLGMEASGAEVQITGMGFARILNGKVLETWDNWDKLAMFQQIEAAKGKSATA